MANGVRTTEVTSGGAVDDLLGNAGGTLIRLPVSALGAQLLSEGPILNEIETIRRSASLGGGLFFADGIEDLNGAPDAIEGDVGFVLVTSTGVYKRGASSWSKVAELPRGFAFSEIDDTSDLDKPVSIAQGAINGAIARRLQATVSPDGANQIEITPYIQVGSLNNDTGIVDPTTPDSRRSIVDLPVDDALTYRFLNFADTLSSLRVAWFDVAGQLLSVSVVYPGEMKNLSLSPPSGAETVNVTIKSGDTDAEPYIDGLVAVFSLASEDFAVTKLNGFEVQDSRVGDLLGQVAEIYTDARGVRFYSNWSQFGLSSGGGVNSRETESHLPIFSASAGAVLTSVGGSMYRINYHADDGVFIAQATFLGGGSFTIPDGLGVAGVSVASTSSVEANEMVVTVTPAQTEIALLGSRLSTLSGELESKQDEIIPENASRIDFLPYVQAGNVDATSGLLVNGGTRRSLIGFPVDENAFYRIFNSADVISTLRVAWFDGANNQLANDARQAGEMIDWTFSPPTGAVSVNLSLKSGDTDALGWDPQSVDFFKSTSDDFSIRSINRFELAGLADDEAISQIIAGGLSVDKVGGVATVPTATPTRSGLLSKDDKAKLDGLVPGDLTVQGSGVFKAAAAFGFLPSASANENVTAMKTAVTGGGIIIVDIPGVYDVNESILLGDNTHIFFGPGVLINKVLFDGKSPKYTFINSGAFTKEWNENISLLGLHIQCNGIGNGSDGVAEIPGMRGHVAFHYIKNLRINDFKMLDGEASSYVIHVCTFEDIVIGDHEIEGWKDAVHLGVGRGFHIFNGRYRTFDDPIALNGHDYASGNPELGWIEQGLIENCWDFADPVRGTTGYFARILAGAWVDWSSGMIVQQSDTVVASNGKMYRVFNASDGATYTSTTEPTHATGTVQHQGINWTMVQENNVTYTAGVRDVEFRNIFLEKPRPTGISVHFDNDDYSRSYYPGAAYPVQDNITLNGIHQKAPIAVMVSCVTPLKNLKVMNSVFGQTRFNLTTLATGGITYAATNILMMANTFTAESSGVLVYTANGRTAKFKALGSIVENDAYVPTFSAGVAVLSSDL